MTARNCVLVVDVSKTFSMYLALLLQRLGFRSLSVREPDAGKIALARGTADFLIIGDQAQAEPPHLVIHKLKESMGSKIIPIIVITHRDDPEERQTCVDAGCQSYLLKPVDPKQLQDSLFDTHIPPEERRKNLRSRVAITAEVAIDGKPKQPHDILSLSGMGALISCSQSIPTETRVTIDIPLDGVTLTVSGTVIYNLDNSVNRGRPAFGVLFQLTNPATADQINSYLEQILKEDRLLPPVRQYDSDQPEEAPAHP
jgi:CheY-like chemotaxis protein